MRDNKMRQLILVAMVLLAVSVAGAEDAPSMWMEQEGDTIVLMVNTSANASGVYAQINFDPESINITDVDFTDSPWVPLAGTGWSNQGTHIILALTAFDGIVAGEYRVAVMDVTCIDVACVTQVSIEKAEPANVTVHDLSYVCGDPFSAATIAIGDAAGTVTIPITISDAVDVGSCDITLSFDPTVVRVVEVSDGAMDCTYSNTEHLDEGWIRIGAVQGDNPGMTGEYTLLNITLEPVGTGDSCALDLSVTTFKDATPDCTPMSYEISSGVYTTPSDGDANSDGDVDLADASYIANHVLGIAGYEYINADAADVNGDGVVDMSDAMYVSKHVLGYPGFEDLR